MMVLGRHKRKNNSLSVDLHVYKARIFLLVDLRELLFRFRVEGTKKNK